MWVGGGRVRGVCVKREGERVGVRREGDGCGCEVGG